NYGGGAVPPPGGVTSHPMLDAASPPRPRAGSPLIGAADAAMAPPADYWGTPRGARAGIGAVQGPEPRAPGGLKGREAARAGLAGAAGRARRDTRWYRPTRD